MSLFFKVSNVRSAVCDCISRTIQSLYGRVPGVVRTAFIIGCATVAYLGGSELYKRRMYFVSVFLSVTARRHANVGKLRDDVRSQMMYEVKASEFNKHGSAAAARSAADHFINNFASHFNRSVWSLSKSAVDIERGIRGSRYYYDGRDLSMECSDDAVERDDIIKLIDVDYYVQMQDLAYYVARGHTVAMYTIIPESVNVSGSDFTGRFVNETELEMVVDGGKPYRHELWDWNRDSVSICDWFSSTRCYVEIKRVSSHRYVVFVIPVVSHMWFAAWLSRWWYSDTLTRVNVGKPVRMLSITNPPRVSVGDPNGGVLEVTVPRAVFDELSIVRQVRGKDLEPASVERVLIARKCDTVGVSLLTLAVNEGRSLPIKPDTNAVSGRHYHCVWADKPYDEGIQKGKFFVPPIIDGAFAAMGSKSDDLACVHGRVELMRNETPKAQTDPNLHVQYLGYMDEFLEFLIPKAHLGVPDSSDDVNEHQDRASQRASWLVEEELSVPSLIADLDAFQKSESYQKCAWPRNITNVDAKHRIDYSRFMYAFNRGCLKPQKWYAFGLKPSEVGELMHDLAQDASVLLEGDFSKWDGSLPHLLRLLERKAGERFFSPPYNNEFMSLHDKLMMRGGRTRHGVRYYVGSSRTSGGADTSAFNTMDDAFVTYCAKRVQGMRPSQAWEKMGLFGGDDNVSNVRKECLEQVCADLGLRIKIIVREAGSYVGFLGRVYTNPWEHSGSCFDIYRALSKFHYTHKNDPNEKREEILWRKAVCLWVTDSSTPLLGCLARNLLRLIPSGKLGEIEHQHWVRTAVKPMMKVRTHSEDIMARFPVPMFPFVDSIEVVPWILENLDCNATAVMEAERAWDGAKSIDEIFVKGKPWFEAKKLEADTSVVLGGELLKPQPTECVPNAPAIAEVPKRPPICPTYVATGKCSPLCTLGHVDCNDYKIGKCTRKVCRFRHIGLTPISSSEASSSKTRKPAKPRARKRG